MRSSPLPLTYDLYRRARQPDTCCAILEGCPFPPMLDPTEWAPAERLEAGSMRPPGFNEDAALFSCRLQGFYIFHWSGRRPKGDPEPLR